MKRTRFLIPIGFLVITAVFSAVVMLLWNWLMPAIFSLGAINFLQALGILILSRILFSNFGVRHSMRNRGMIHGRNHIREKWLKMTPGQRKEFLNKRREYFNRTREQFAEGDFFGAMDFDPFLTGEDSTSK